MNIDIEQELRALRTQEPPPDEVLARVERTVRRRRVRRRGLVTVAVVATFAVLAIPVVNARHQRAAVVAAADPNQTAQTSPTDVLPAQPTLVVGASAPLANDTRVTFTGAGYAPAEQVSVLVCVHPTATAAPGSSTCDQTSAVVLGATQDGSISGEIVVSRWIFSSSGFEDCTVNPGGCALVAVVSPEQEVVAPLTFDDTTGQPHAASLALSPAGPFQPNASVAVRGSGFPANTPIDLGVCDLTAVDNGTEQRASCVYSPSGSAQSDASGNFELSALKLIADESGAGVACLSSGHRCALEWYPADGTPAYVSYPLEFSAS